MELVFICPFLAKVFFSEPVVHSKRDQKFLECLPGLTFGQAWLVDMAVGKTVEV